MKASNKLDKMTRRKFLLNTGLMGGLAILPGITIGRAGAAVFRGKSSIEGINLGVITYSFRSMPGTAEDLLNYLTELNLSSVELMGTPLEEFAGAPEAPARTRGNLTDAERKEVEDYRAELRKWRTTVPMKPFKDLRKKYNDNGVDVEIIKLRLDSMTEQEISYAFKVAQAVGAKGITLERSDEAVEKLSPFADQYKALIGYHNHTKVNFNSWDRAVQLSKYNALNLDVGHYVAGTNKSPIPLIEKYHDRILNLHLKDRKMNEGDNMPWGQGDTPLKEILRLMRDRNYQFMGTIELEYPIPEGSNAVKEVKRCIDFCQDALDA